MPERAPEVEQVVREWLSAKLAGDAGRIRADLSDYAGVLAIGTEADEWWWGAPAFADAHASQPGFSAVVDSIEAHREGAAAWAAVRATVQTGEPGGLPVRLTLVLVREDGAWRIVQSHASA